MPLKKDSFQRQNACDNWPVIAKQSYRRLKPLKPTKKVRATQISTKADRDQEQARQRYLRFNKAELVDRLLAAEYAYAEQEQRWLSQQDETFTWRLRAEAAEARLNALPRHAIQTSK